MRTITRSITVLVGALLVGSALVTPLAAGLAVAADDGGQTAGNAAHLDFGDAPDPDYPTNESNDGSRHVDPHRVWLGENVTSEETPNLIDADEHDDGFRTNASSPDELTVLVTNEDATGETFYVNLLVDANGDGDWTDDDEWEVRNHEVVVATGETETVNFTVGPETVSYLNGSSDEGGYTRLTLTAERIPEYTGHGEYEFGETEDYSREAMMTVAGPVDDDGNGFDHGDGFDVGSTAVANVSVSPVTPGDIGPADSGTVFVGDIDFDFEPGNISWNGTGGDGFHGGGGGDGNGFQDDGDGEGQRDRAQPNGRKTVKARAAIADDDEGDSRRGGRAELNDRKTVQPRDLLAFAGGDPISTVLWGQTEYEDLTMNPGTNDGTGRRGAPQGIDTASGEGGR